jgi:protein TonB
MPSRIPNAIAKIHDLPALIAAAPELGRGGKFADGVSYDPGLAIGSGTPAATPPPPPPPPAPPPAKANRPSTPKIIHIGGKVMEAKIVKRVMPTYPPLAKQARISGTVRLEGIISRDGRIINLHVVQGHPLLTQAALQAVSQWLYQPTLLNGEPVEVMAPIDVHFTLSQ